MERIKILDDALWQTVPPDVIKEAEQTALGTMQVIRRLLTSLPV
jgi:hypothetical protein